LDPQVYALIGVALGVFLIIMVAFMAGVHHRQHWETDRMVEGKLMRE
jgi:hypothetical protein